MKELSNFIQSLLVLLVFVGIGVLFVALLRYSVATVFQIPFTMKQALFLWVLKALLILDKPQKD